VRRFSVLQQNSLNIVLEQAIFKMDEVIVSTAFNKLQSQNVMKVEHATIKELQQGTATLIEGLHSRSFASFNRNLHRKTSNSWFSGNRVLVYSQGVRMENQQFGDEHGLG
jgi:iron complex outermembrane receptor protein